MDDKTTGAYAPAGSFLGSGKAIDADSGFADGAMSYNCGSGGYGNSGMNPYITKGEFGTLCPETAGGAPLAYTNSANVASATPLFPYQMSSTGIGQILIGRRNVEGGPREDEYEHSAYRGVFGARGKITDAWTYDAYGLFSKTQSSDHHNNDTSTQRMQNALLAVSGPNGPVCSGGEAGCVPWNIFDPSTPVSAAALSYITVPGVFLASSEEEMGEAYVSGDMTTYGIKTPWARRWPESRVRHGLSSATSWQACQTWSMKAAISPASGRQRRRSPQGNTSGKPTRKSDCRSRTTCRSRSRWIWKPAIAYSSYSEGYKTNTFKAALEWAPVERCASACQLQPRGPRTEPTRALSTGARRSRYRR